MAFYFIRHSESLKSKEDRHGGEGLPLTNQGKIDTLEIIDFLEQIEKVNFQNSLLFCSNLVQVLETAKVIESDRNVKFKISNAIKNISLGILDGLSKGEANEKYPIVAKNLDLWRKGKIKIDDFTIPNAETMEQFYTRIFNFIDSLGQTEKDILIIGTRSVGVAISNIFKDYASDIDFEKYERSLFDPSSVSKFKFEIDQPKICYLNNTEFLTLKATYPDN